MLIKALTDNTNVLVSLMCLVDQYGDQVTRSYLLEACSALPDAEEVVETLIQYAHTRLNEPLTETDKRIFSGFEQEFDQEILVQILYYIRTPRDLAYLKRMLVPTLVLQGKDFIKKMTHNNAYLLIKKVCDMIISRITTHLEHISVARTLARVDRDLMEDLILHLKFEELTELSDEYGNIVTEDDAINFNTKVRSKLEELEKVRYSGSIKFRTDKHELTLESNSPASKLRELVEDDYLVLVCQKSYRRDKDESILMNTPPPPRLKIKKESLDNVTVKELVDVIPKSWNDKTLKSYFGLIYTDHISIV